jgi:sigma-E factor negative regulatory protein RseA
VAENIKESLSALIDGEASEIELHRLLREVEQDSSLKRNWAIWQQIRNVINGKPVYSVQQHLDLSTEISAAVAAESELDVKDGLIAKRSRFIKPLSGLAVAASITLAVTVGFNKLNTQPASEADAGFVDTQSTSNLSTPTLAGSPVTNTIPAGNTQSVSVADNTDGKGIASRLANVQVLDPVIESDLRELPPEKEQRFRAYLLQQDRQMQAYLNQQQGSQTRTVIHKEKKSP